MARRRAAAGRTAAVLRPREKAPIAADERAQALVLLAAGGAAVEMGAQARERGVGVLAGELELDVAVELVEAVVAADLGLAGPSSRPSACFEIGSFVIVSSSQSSSARPRSSRCSRSLRRASCSVL